MQTALSLGKNADGFIFMTLNGRNGLLYIGSQQYWQEFSFFAPSFHEGVWE
jgi:hypothetical protein